MSNKNQTNLLNPKPTSLLKPLKPPHFQLFPQSPNPQNGDGGGHSGARELQSRAKAQRIAKEESEICGFESLGLSPNVYNGVKKKGYKVPIPIKRKTMPLILSGNDVVAMARTGSGKTAAFLIHMLEKLKQLVPQSGVRALILSPTRDLAIQSLKFTKQLGRFTDLRVSNGWWR